MYDVIIIASNISKYSVTNSEYVQDMINYILVIRFLVISLIVSYSSKTFLMPCFSRELFVSFCYLINAGLTCHTLWIQVILVGRLKFPNI